MKSCIIFILVLALIVALPSPTLSQTPPKADQDDEKIVVGTNEIILDAVVKDKRGRAVKDLKASDFEIYEDGVPQQIKSFRLITREAEPSNAPNDDGHAINPTGTTQHAPRSIPTFSNGAVALVFDRLSADSRSQARKAALGYIGEGLRRDDFVGVFGIDLSLKVWQTFTNNGQLVRQAIDRASAHSSSTYSSSSNQIADISQTQSQLDSQASTLTAGDGQSVQGNAGAIGANAVEQAFSDMTARLLEGFERLEHDQQGYATTNGLLAIVDAMGRLPGRKSLIFFSEGISIPPSVQSHFNSVISAANRANVSIYSVDAAGLRAMSSDATTARAISALGQKRARQAASSSDSFGSMMRDLERNEDLLRQDPDSGLGVLANETGGLLINNTNNLSGKLREISEDLHTYYVLTYTSQNQNYDGRFRNLNVKVKRSGTEVQARKGYFAINASYSSPVLDYEAPALAILSRNPPTSAFLTRAAAFSFPEPKKPGLVPVVIEVPSSAINFVADREKNLYQTNFSIVALIKDASQRVVRKLSNQYSLSGSLDKLEAAKKGQILFYRETQLEPGRYTFSSVVYDATDGKFSTNTGNIFVPETDNTKLQLSSIIIIKSAERLAPDQQTSNPFHFGEVLIYPNLGESLHQSVAKNLALFVTVYPPQATPSTPKLNLAIMQGGRALGQAVYNLPSPDQSGRIQYASAIPIDKLQAGEYELKITVTDGKGTATRAEHFSIKP